MITLSQLDAEVRSMAAQGGIDPHEVRVLLWSPDEERTRTSRDFAYVYGPVPEVHFSKHTLGLGNAHREALIAHELGHVLAIRTKGDYSEPGADRAAQQILGIPICYDRRNYPGKGLQVRCIAANPAHELAMLDTEVWPDGTVIQWLAQPFPFERKPYVPSRLERTATVRRVPIDRLVATQHRVTERGVQKYLGADDPDAPGDMPMTYRTPSGKIYIGDGHHRATAKWLEGEPTILARVIEIEENPLRSCMPRAHTVARRLANGYSR